MNEIWKDIKGFDRYQVSNLGRVRSKEFIRINTRFQHGHLQSFEIKYPAKILKQDTNKISSNTSNYKRVTLSKDGITKKFSVHRLVAEAFIDNPNNLPFVNHKDNNGTNNMVDNLEWCTHSENMKYAQNQGRLLTSQSKAGKRAGVLAKERQLKTIQKLTNTKVNDWTVLGDTIFVGSNNKAKVLCKCKCGFEKYQFLYRINLKQITCCNHCRKKR